MDWTTLGIQRDAEADEIRIGSAYQLPSGNLKNLISFLAVDDNDHEHGKQAKAIHGQAKEICDRELGKLREDEKSGVLYYSLVHYLQLEMLFNNRDNIQYSYLMDGDKMRQRADIDWQTLETYKERLMQFFQERQIVLAT